MDSVYAKRDRGTGWPCTSCSSDRATVPFHRKGGLPLISWFSLRDDWNVDAIALGECDHSGNGVGRMRLLRIESAKNEASLLLIIPKWLISLLRVAWRLVEVKRRVKVKVKNGMVMLKVAGEWRVTQHNKEFQQRGPNVTACKKETEIMNHRKLQLYLYITSYHKLGVSSVDYSHPKNTLSYIQTVL